MFGGEGTLVTVLGVGESPLDKPAGTSGNTNEILCLRWRPFCFSVAQIYLVLMQDSWPHFHVSPTQVPSLRFNTQIGMSTALFNL